MDNVMASFKALSCHLLGGVEKTTKSLSQDSGCLGLYSNLATSEHKSEAALSDI
jgi:hypothetical protein